MTIDPNLDATQIRQGVLHLSRRLRAEKADNELSDGQFSVLACLYRHGAHTLGGLAEHERVSPPSMNRTVNCLEGSGYVERAADPTDGRRVLISLTPEGHDMVARTVVQRDAWIDTRLRDLSPEERETLTRAAEIMRRLATA
ncbi:MULTISPECIES: MarR family winged helix-turn-helix transcriptional regulator [Mycetocola]|uniref:MarR family transcriptional regulator n=1 Tax=Mycetocola lacteus TaxID=76637 RepID=A0A3L7AG21_9MICO|nr:MULTISPECIES: MarR family transcriptional regulator [Mycetocola]MCS4276570.1 DNA-binding MarR family transcriptional regulator [Mycetocola sp. BIGb0189]RLP79406.1 MarR family transcriptional regulator [Mycetocola lacteus]